MAFPLGADEGVDDGESAVCGLVASSRVIKSPSLSSPDSVLELSSSMARCLALAASSSSSTSSGGFFRFFRCFASVFDWSIFT
jgi:hypothetical protein